MACNDSNPCTSCTDTTTQCPCLYDNCGCLNPTTFGCTTTNKVRECLGTTSGEDGESILDKIETKVCDIGKVLIDVDDDCPEYLFDKLAEGTNISLSIIGEGCDRQIRIDAVEGGTPPDINAKISSSDTTTGYLDAKILVGTYLSKTIITPSGNAKMKLDVVPSTLLSTDLGNQLTLGVDGKLKTSYTTPDGSETIVTNGVGTTVTGTGTVSDPYIISTNPAIQIVRPCFDSVWRNVTLVATGNANVVYTSGAPQYRYRYDGTVEFRGQATYTVAFGAYTTSNRKYTITIGSIPTTCLSGGELAGVADLKSINYIDIPQASADQITQQYGYIIRKSVANLIVEFQSSFTAITSKSIVVNFEGSVIHPLLP